MSEHLATLKRRNQYLYILRELDENTHLVFEHLQKSLELRNQTMKNIYLSLFLCAAHAVVALPQDASASRAQPSDPEATQESLRLIGFEGCKKKDGMDPQFIYDAWAEFEKMVPEQHRPGDDEYAYPHHRFHNCRLMSSTQARGLQTDTLGSTIGIRGQQWISSVLQRERWSTARQYEVFMGYLTQIQSKASLLTYSSRQFRQAGQCAKRVFHLLDSSCPLRRSKGKSSS